MALQHKKHKENQKKQDKSFTNPPISLATTQELFPCNPVAIL